MNLNMQKVKQALEENNVTGTQFAIRFGIHRSFVYNAMSGAVTPGRKFFAAWAKFCKVFELNFLDFIDFEEDDYLK